MKTITNCFLYIAIMTVLCIIDILCLAMNICAYNWWLTALCTVAIVVGVWVILSAYKRAKGYEEIILESVDSALGLAMLATAKTLRMEAKELLPKIEELKKDKKDEVAEDNGTPE